MYRRSLCLASCATALLACDLDGGSLSQSHDLWNENQRVNLPLPAGTSAEIQQGFHGYYSHSGASAYAVDFALAEGTVVVAARSGRVIATRSDSDRGCAEPRCRSDSNFIVIDHGDGTIARYLHLKQGGVDVSVGDMVCRGTPIGRSGNTGFSSGPHLHFEIQNVHGESIPLQFEEIAALTRAESGGPFPGRRVEGVPFPGVRITSANHATSCAGRGPSTCDDAFIHFGVRLLDETPCTSARFDRPYHISGISYGSADHVVVAQGRDGVWRRKCVEVSRSPGALFGTFSTTLAWPREIYSGAEETYLMVSSSAHAEDGRCLLDRGYSRSARIFLSE